MRHPFVSGGDLVLRTNISSHSRHGLFKSSEFPGSTMAIITVNGSEAVTGQWRRSVGTATHSSYNKNLIAIRIL